MNAGKTDVCENICDELDRPPVDSCIVVNQTIFVSKWSKCSLTITKFARGHLKMDVMQELFDRLRYTTLTALNAK